MVGITKPAILKRIHRGKLPAVQDGGRFWVRYDHLELAPLVVANRFLTRDQAAKELGVSPWVVYSLIRKGRLPAIRIRIGGRGSWRVSREDLEAYRRGSE